MRVSIKVSGGIAELIAEMAGIRDWLNEHDYSTSRFDCRKSGNAFFVSLDFNEPEPAREFDRRFGQVSQSPNQLQRSANLLGKPHPRTMAQARAWRWMAQTLRTKADEFASVGRKRPWPALVEIALTYDRMAENLERRLAKQAQPQQRKR